MPIDYVIGDATDPPREGGPVVIVHVCNDIGGWGRGFVLALSRRWTEPERHYRAWHRGEEELPFALGQVQFLQVEPQVWVANLIGQHGVRGRSSTPPVRYEAIREGLKTVADFASQVGAAVHMPRIGCGLAGGDWDTISGIISDELCDRNLPVTIYDLP